MVGSILASGIALCAVIIIRRDPHSGKRAELERLDRTPGSYVDITRHTETEEALKLSRAFAQNVIASSLDMIIVVDKDRRILEFNRAAQDAFGHRPDDVLGHAFDMLYLDERLGNQNPRLTDFKGPIFSEAPRSTQRRFRLREPAVCLSIEE